MKNASHDLILAQLRDLICNGKLKQGAKIPTRSELAQYFSVSQSTIQKAMVNLEEDGFVESHGKKGSFISNTPPHIYRYAFSFPFDKGDLRWGPRFDTLIRVAEELKSQGSNYRLYHGEDDKNLEALASDLKKRRVAGAICLGSHENYVNTIQSSLHSRVATLANLPIDDLHLPIHIETKAFQRHVADWIQDNQLRHVAVISNHLDTEFDFPLFQEHCMERSIKCLSRQHFKLSPPFHSPSIINIIQTLGSLDDSQRPDVLFLSDDALIPEESLLKNCLQNYSFAIVARGHFPLHPSRSPSVITHIGLDIQDLVLQLVDAMRNFQLGRSSPPSIHLPFCQLDTGSMSPRLLEGS